MSKVKLALGAELDLLNSNELGSELSKSSNWEREAAFGLRHQDLPRMIGKVDGSGNLALGGDQADQSPCGPTSGFYWAVKRVSVDGLASSEQAKLWKGTRFVAWVAQQPGFVTFGKEGLVLKPGDFLRLTGSGLTSSEQITVTGEAVSVPGPLMWKLLS
jgi:hypothetical protein